MNNYIKLLNDNNIDESNYYYLEKYLDDKSKMKESINRLIKGEPVQYIVGNVDFYGNEFKVTKDTLIPRFETEELVEKTINYIKKYFKDKVDIVDIGTGTGCIAITLNKYISSNVDAVDISKKALDVAKENNKLNYTNVNFIEGSLLEPLTKKYDVLISNPPYIAYDEEIMDIVKNNEPHLALYADNNGLKCYEEILKNAKRVLNNRNMIAFEIGYTQGKEIIKIANQYFDNCETLVLQDLQGKDRFVFIFNNI